MEFLIQLCQYHWSPQDRARIARMLPYVYAKLTDTRVQVDTDTDHVIIQAAPSPKGV